MTENREQNLNLEQMFGEAELSLKKGLQSITEWSDQARDIMRNRPGVALACISIAGFVTGALLRQGRLNPRNRSARSVAGDPMITFLTGAIAGFTVGPRVLQEFGQTQGQTQTPISRVDTEPMGRH